MRRAAPPESQAHHEDLPGLQPPALQGVAGRILARLDRRVPGEEGAGMTLEEVGGILNLTRERVRQIQHLALLRIKAGMRRAI